MGQPSEDEREWAWAAGLFEGEGCIFKTGHCLCAAVSMTDLDVLETFQRIVGVGKIHGPRERPAKNKPSWEWNLSSPEMVLERFLPYLGVRRTARFLELVAWRKDFLSERLQEKICIECGIPFVPSSVRTAERQRSCSVQCGQKTWKRAQLYASRSNRPPCEECGNTIPLDCRRRRFCSIKCNKKWHVRNSNRNRRTCVA